MFLGWYDPDRRKTLERKLDDALDRYREKFNAEPVTVLTSIADADSLQKAALQRNLLLKGVRFVSGSTFLVGSEDESDRQRRGSGAGRLTDGGSGTVPGFWDSFATLSPVTRRSAIGRPLKKALQLGFFRVGA